MPASTDWFLDSSVMAPFRRPKFTQNNHAEAGPLTPRPQWASRAGVKSGQHIAHRSAADRDRR